MEVGDLLKTTLKSYQKDQVAILSKRRHALLVEKTGKGKTYTVLSSFAILFTRKKLTNLLVFTPRNAYQRKVWKINATEHTNLKSIDLETLYEKAGHNPAKLQKFLDHYQVIYGKHTHIYKYYDFIRTLVISTKTCVTIDEIHAFKNHKSKLHITMIMVLSSAKAVWGMSATPLSKDMNDVYSIVNLIKPWFLGSFEDFKRTHCRVEQQIIGRYPNGGLKKIEKITGIINEFALQTKLNHMVITGKSSIQVKWHFVKYEMSPHERYLYQKIARGVFASRLENIEKAEDWFKHIMNNEEVETDFVVKETVRHSSRFLYLQFAADGIISDNGLIGDIHGNKCQEFLKVIKEIIGRGESSIVYFSYYAALESFERLLKKSIGDSAKVVHSTGKKTLKPGDVSEAQVKVKPHLILATKAGSESDSFYYINNVILFHNPTIPDTFTQIVGRITRINTLFPDNLNVYLSKVENIDMYKLARVSHKSAQMEIVTKEELNIPPDLKQQYKDANAIQLIKKYLLWNLM